MSRYPHDTEPTPPDTPEPAPLTPDQMYPGWRWNAAGDSKIVANATEDEAAAAEGYTLKSPPAPPSATPLPAPTPLPYPKRLHHHDGRTKTVYNELDEDTAAAEGFKLEAERKDTKKDK